jgi:NAD(P)H-hydrate epimerase
MMSCPTEIAKSFPKRPLDLNKYTVGTVTIVGGSSHYIHAPVLAGLGARVGGAGLIHLVVPDASKIAASNLIPEATFLKQTPVCVPPRSDVTAIGMGLGMTPTSELLVSRLLSGSNARFVIDADALNVLANWYAKRPTLPVFDGPRMILTPHAGEAARLLAVKTEDILADRKSAIKQIVERYNATVILKGPNTLVASPDISEIYECDAGNPYMALGGMGDLLSGIVAARWAYLSHQMPETPPERIAFDAARSSVWLHATASDSLIKAEEPIDPSVKNTAKAVSTIRVILERSR